MRQDSSGDGAHTLHGAFARQAALHPDRVALLPADGPGLTYARLLDRTTALADVLARCGAGPGTRVTVLGGRTANTVVALLGVLRTGAAYCVVDSSLPASRLALIVADLDPAALVVTDPEAAAGPHGSVPVLCLDEVSGRASVATAPATVPARPARPARSDDLAYVMYTSGSTGRPKGVLVEHGSVLNMVESYEALAPAAPAFSGSLVSPTAFDVSVWEIFSVLAYGGTLHVPAPSSLRGGEELWDFLRTAGIDSAYVPPGLVTPLVEAAERDGGHGYAPQRVLVGVEPIPQGALERFRKACPGLRVVNGYGPTETTVTATLHLFERMTDQARRTPIGRAVAGSTVSLVDERLLPVGPGAVGEIVVSGDCLARGYWAHEEEENKRFVALDGRRSYRTGDYGRFLDNGELEFVGRRDDQVKVHGFRVELGEVEAALTRAPLVRRCVVRVVGRPHARRLVAAVEAPDGVRPTDLRQHAAMELPAHMVPSRVLVTDSFPMTGNGKVDVDRLFTLDRGRPSDGPPYVAADTPEEERICRVWAEVLDLDEVGAEDDFHWLGGVSLDAVRISARLREEGVLRTASEVLSARTVRALAALEPGPEVEVVEHAARPGRYPTSRAHQGLWAWREFHPDSSSSTVVHALRLGEALSPEQVREALALVVDRHEALRTTFQLTREGKLVQHVEGTVPVDVPLVRVADEAEVDALVLAALDQRLDARSRPWQAELLLGPGFGVLLFVADHLVFDGESAVVLERDLVRACESPDRYAREGGVPGPASPGVLAAPEPERGRRLREYWRQALEGVQDVPVLPAPLERAGPRTRPARTTRDLPLWERARELARREGTTPFVFVLAALKAFLRRRQGHPDNTVSVAFSRRHDLGYTASIGHMVNLLPVRDRVNRDDQRRGFRSYLADVARLFREAVDHGDLPFEDMLGEEARVTGQGTPAPARVVLAQRVRGLPEHPGHGQNPHVSRWPDLPSNSPYELTLFLDEGDSSAPPRLSWVAAGNACPDGALELVAEGFDAFWSAVVGAPDTALEDLPCLGRSEEELIRRTALPRVPEAEVSLVDLFADQVRSRPEAVALREGGRSISYRELAERATEIASSLPPDLAERGPVAVVLDKCGDLPAALLAVLRSGGAYLPLAPEHARTRLPALVDRAAVSVCVTRSDLVEEIGLPEGVPRVLVDGPTVAGPPAPGEEPPPARVTPAHLAYVMPTSGTSGEPKLVGVPHRGVVRLVRHSRTLPLDTGDVTMLVSNVSFDAATFEIWGALANGGLLVLPEPEELADPRRLCAAVERHGVTAGFFTVSLFERLLETEPSRLSGMRHLIVGGEAVPPRVLARAGAHVPPNSLVNGYGPTENTTFSCCHRIHGDVSRLRSTPIGPPVDGSGAVVLGTDLKALPVGLPGEIAVSGHGLAHGYLNDPELTARRFVELKQFGGLRVYLTGDSGRLLPDGTLEYLGRLDRQVKIRGFRVEPGEVEAQLESHPSVRRAAAYAEQIAGTSTLRAAVEADGVDGDHLRRWLQERLPGYLVPDRVHVFGAFPLTENGKLDHASVRQRSRGTSVTKVGPSTEDGETDSLIRIWVDLLGEEEIMPESDFFRLGANSITVLALSARLHQELGWDVPTHVVYSVRTVRGIADYARSSPLARLTERERQRNQALARAGKIRKATRRKRS
ncbi:amino acid adenylation domain-containing protein [Nocardiopsis synnemataformans]|uniref:amino acid adenylation domain-containing protein n=1 Tax=Nocardiopsis synnemataformans TaxID=61305 RepID=UPI003EB7F05C